MPVEKLLLAAGVLLLAAVGASKISSRLGVPSLLLFIAIGMLAGSDGPGGIWFDNALLAQSLGVVALALILFSGGVETNWNETAPTGYAAFSLATIGVVLTAAVVGATAHLFFDFSLLQGLLLGAIVSSTDAAAVFSVLRTQGVGLKGKLQPLLELESGSNDPMAVFLTVAFTQLLESPSASVNNVLPMFITQMTIGGALGFTIGKGTVWLINRLRLDSDGLYPVLTLAVVFFIYSATAALGGSGFLAVYIAGVVMGNSDFIHKRSLVRFHNALAWLMQIAMFLTLGLLVFPSRLPSVAAMGAVLAFCLVFVARPISVFIALAFSRYTVREKLLVSWIGLRGAVPIILATFPLVARLSGAELYFDVVFFIVITSVLLQGTSISLVARWLSLEAAAVARPTPALEFLPAAKSSSDLIEVLVPETSTAANKQIVDLPLPPSALIVLLTRNENYVVPRGSTVVHPGDSLLVLAEHEEMSAVRRIIEVGVAAGAETKV